MGIFKQAFTISKEEMLPYFYYLGATGLVGAVTYERIQTVFDSPKAFYTADAGKLEKTGLFTAEQITHFMEKKKEFNLFSEYERALKLGIKTLSVEDPEYPEKLKTIKDYAPVLYMKGSFPKEGVPYVSVIGARECSGYGSAVAARLGELLAAAGVAVISGMARGIDSISQIAALEAGGYSLAFLGGGVDVVYPRESRRLYEILSQRGGIISEFAPGVMPMKTFFARRNRLISGISDALCVVEAKEKSGTMITVDCALEQGRDVYAVPGRISDITSFGTNSLIRQGAGVVADLNAFVEEMLRTYGGPAFMPLTKGSKKKKPEEKYLENEIAVIRLLDENSFTADALSSTLKMQSYEILGLCMGLCDKGILKSMGAGRFVSTEEGILTRNKIVSAENEDEDLP